MEEERLTEETIIETLIKLMEQADAIVNYDGQKKKAYVMACIKTLLGEEAYNRYYYFIVQFIDFAVQVSKGNIKININNIKRKYCCF
jgi:hypothetical protein